MANFIISLYINEFKLKEFNNYYYKFFCNIINMYLNSKFILNNNKYYLLNMINKRIK